jgi:phosphatidylglycerol---prolipoprotein diacylglyceryl transferase
MHPVLLELGSFTIYTYGLFVAVAMIVSYLMAVHCAADAGISRQEMTDLFFTVFVGGIVGARTYFVIQNWQDYAPAPVHVFFLREGGLVWYGGFAGAMLTGLAYAKWKGWDIPKLLDYAAPIIPMAHGIGRIGCYFNGCCFGKNGIPAQLIEAGALFLVTAILLFCKRKNLFSRKLFAVYVFCYSFTRFITEFFRGDQPVFHYFTFPQWLSIFFFIAASFILFVKRKKSHGQV